VFLLSLLLFTAAVIWLLLSHRNIARMIADYMVGGLDGALIVTRGISWIVFAFTILLVLICAANILIFWLCYAVGFFFPTLGQWFWIGGLLFGLFQAGMAMLVFYIIRLPLQAASNKAEKWNAAISSAFPKLAIPFPKDWFTGLKTIFAPVVFFFCLIVNTAYMPFAVIMRSLGGIIGLIGAALALASKTAYTMARIFGYICLVALTTGSLISLELITGIHFVDTVTVLLVIGIVAVIVVLMVMAETLFTGKGITIASWVMGIVSMSVFVVVLLAYLDPSIASGVGRRLVIAHTQVAKTLHLSDTRDEDSSDIWVVAVRRIPFQYVEQQDLLTGEMSLERFDQPVLAGTIGVRNDPYIPAKTAHTRRAMEKIIWCHRVNDPECVLVDTKVQEGLQEARFVTKTELEFFSSYEEATARADAIINSANPALGNLSRISYQPAPQQPTASASWQGNISPRYLWADTGLAVNAGNRISVTASGQVTWSERSHSVPDQFKNVGPGGTTFMARVLEPGLGDSDHFVYPDAPPGSLLMKVGSEIYLVGASKEIVVSQGGQIQFMVNDRPGWMSENTGSFQVRVEVR
jgi:hypothetical protein